MNKIRVILACGAAGMMLSACTQGATGPPSTTSVDTIGNSKLQLAVGTANFAGVGGLNVVSTLRQPNGDSAVLVDTPTLTGPFTLPPVSTFGTGIDSYDTILGCTNPAVCPVVVAPGPSTQEVAAGGTFSGTPQTVHPGTPACDSVAPTGFTQCPAGVSANSTTFGQSGGVFGMGFAPYNHTNSGVPRSYVPYSQPIFDTTPNAFIPWGGPPAFDPNHDNMGTRDGTFNLGAALLGVGMGITMFEGATPGAGTYTLSVAIPTSPTSIGTVSATATLTSTALLPTLAAPAFAPDATGGGTVTVAALPAPMTEGYIEVIDFGGAPAACQGPIGGSAFPVYYTIHITGAGNYALPDLDGPNIGGANPTPSQTLCTGDNYTVFVVGVDYPLYAASYPNSLGTQTPALVGAAGQDDISISSPFTSTYARVPGPARNDHRTLRSMNRYHPHLIRHR